MSGNSWDSLWRSEFAHFHTTLAVRAFAAVTIAALLALLAVTVAEPRRTHGEHD